MDLVFLFCWILSIFFEIKFILAMYEKHKRDMDNVINCDRKMSEFVYKVYMSKEEIINSLKIMNIKDELSCTFDFDKDTVLITDISRLGSSGPRKEYYYEIQEYSGFSILKLSVVSLFGDQKAIGLKLNPFLVSKINAEVVPFSQYGN